MSAKITLTDMDVFEQAVAVLVDFKKTNKVRSPNISVLLALIYYGTRKQIPFIDDSQEGVRKKSIELFADSIYEKKNHNPPIRMLFTGAWMRGSGNSDVNNWRNATDCQAGLRCDASLPELQDLGYVVSERDACMHRNNDQRLCTISNVGCHNPTKKGGSGPTNVPSAPKVLTHVNDLYKIVSLEPSVLRKALPPDSERIPIFPFLYALYFNSVLFQSPPEITITTFVEEFGLGNDALDALFDSDPHRARNRQFLEVLANKKLIDFVETVPDLLGEQISVLDSVINGLIGLEFNIGNKRYIISKTDWGFALHNSDFHLSFDLAYAGGILLSKYEDLSKDDRHLYEILFQSKRLIQAFALVSFPEVTVEIRLGGDLLKGHIDEIVKDLESRIEEEMQECIEKSVPVLDDRETESVTEAKVRICQRVFRKRILDVHNNKCFICGMSITNMLVASHIIPWSHQKSTRLDLRNGLCLCSLHDRAFDTGLITISYDSTQDTYILHLSEDLETFLTEQKVFKSLFPTEVKSEVAADYRPNVEFLEYHYKTIFKG